MDLVSTTLDRYLKHRFNGIQVEQTNTTDIQKQEELLELPKIYHISIENTQPCCIGVQEDLKFLAAGFENSHIHLWKLKHPSYSIGKCSTLLAHTGPVYGIKFFNHNDLMLSCSEDTTIRLWCLKTECNLAIFRGHNYPIWDIDIGPRGSLFASCSMDTTSRLWRLDKITPLRIFCGHDDNVEVVKFHPNEKYIATGSSDTTIRLWSVSDGLMVRSMVGHESRIISLSFLPDGKFLASASCDGVIKLWNLATNSVTSQLNVTQTHMISFNPDQNFICSCGVDNILSLSQLFDTSSPTHTSTGLVERRNINFNESSSMLIKSQFIKENKLFVISFKKEENK